MKRQLLLLVFLLCFISFRYCKNDDIQPEKDTTQTPSVVTLANSYKGVSYKAGGTTKNGMDCSGLVYTVFKDVGIQLPRSSKNMSTKGAEISLDKVQVGDLLFFDIARLKGNINHVGLVTSIKNNEILFIHATTKKGILTSSMNETYWKNEFVKAKRIL